MADIKYSAIVTFANRGFSSEVMEAAKTGGASGGSVINSRRVTNEEVVSKWGLSVQDEKELIIIVAPDAKKADIMKAISEKCGVHSEAKGLVLSLPIESVIGLNTDEEDEE